MLNIRKFVRANYDFYNINYLIIQIIERLQRNDDFIYEDADKISIYYIYNAETNKNYNLINTVFLPL
jgi:hypothetical protein